jgi:hypothetical protein
MWRTYSPWLHLCQYTQDFVLCFYIFAFQAKKSTLDSHNYLVFARKRQILRYSRLKNSCFGATQHIIAFARENSFIIKALKAFLLSFSYQIFEK